MLTDDERGVRRRERAVFSIFSQSPHRVCSLQQISQTRGQELQRVASTAESLTAQAPSPGMVPAAEAAAAGSLASLATQVQYSCSTWLAVATFGIPSD